MGIFTRIARLCRSDLHGVMDQLEDKDLLLKQYVREMEEALKHKQAGLSRMARTRRELERNLAARQKTLTGLESDLDLAVTRDRDDIARSLIRKRRTLEAGCIRLQQQMESLQEEHDALAETVERQTLEYERLKAKAAVYHRQAEQQRDETPDVFDEAPLRWGAPSEEEIELELLQRKEALGAGGGS